MPKSVSKIDDVPVAQLEWAMRAPNPHGEDTEGEIRQFFELEDFSPSEAVEHYREPGKQLAKQKK